MDQPDLPTHDNAEATRLLQQLQDGDPKGAEALLPLVYEELRHRAAAYFRNQRDNVTLEPTALVHEAFVRMVNAPSNEWRSRAHFCAVAATAMRQILIDHARRRRLAKAERDRQRQLGTRVVSPAEDGIIDLEALDVALTKLAKLNEEHARLVELRFFGGMSNSEIAEVLGVSVSTVNNHWRRVSAWLNSEIQAEPSS